MRNWNVIAAAAMLVSSAWSQSFTPVREQRNLSAEALSKLHTLEFLNALPEGEWHVHVGDLSHGEAVGLDDSAWPLAQAGRRGGVREPKDAVWFRRVVEVPKMLQGYDVSGSRIWFQFRADANGPMPEIVYFNGRRVALGDDLEPIVLFESAKPGDQVVIAVKLLHTVDEKRFEGVRMKIEPAAGLRPNPDDLRIQCIAAANLLPALPTPRRDLLPRVEAAVAAIDTDALAKGEQALFDTSLRKAQSMLDELHGAMQQAVVDLAGNSHIDAAWLWPRSETIDIVRRTFSTVLQLMNEYPDYTFTQSAAQYTEWMAEKYPAMNAEIKRRVKEGRWEIVGGMWVEPDLNLPGGESLVRQLMVGQREFQKEYGVTARIGWNPDSFGYNWQLPQIYKRSGLDYFVTQKMHWNDTNQLPFRLFWWESPDGSKVLTYFPTDYVHDNVNPTRITADFAESAQRNPGTSALLDLYGIGDHGGGPTRDMLDQADHWIAAETSTKDAVPAMRYGTAQRYFSDVEGKLNPDSPEWNYDKIAQGWTAPAGSVDQVGVPTWKDELYFEFHRGVYTTQAVHKRNLRVSETETLNAEKLSSLAWLSGKAYPADRLNETWKKITFNQFHDLAAGSGIGVIYKDAQRDFDEVFQVDEEVSAGAMKELEARIDTRVKTGVPVLVFNAEAWPRSETATIHVQMPDAAEGVQVFDAENRAVPVQVVAKDAVTHSYDLLAAVENVPAMGYKVLHVEARSGGVKTGLKAEEQPDRFVLSNGSLRVTVAKSNGCISSLKAQEKEFLANGACGNQLQTWKDLPKQYDAWNIDPGTLDGPMTPIETVDSVVLSERGPVRATVRITRHRGSSRFTQEISLDADAREVEVGNEVDWHETHVLLKAAFPLAASSQKATFEIPYGSMERPTTRNNSFEKAQFEVPALRWADLGDATQGVSLLNDSKYGYDALGNTLRLTLLRSPVWPDPDADRGAQRFRYAIYPHAGSWKDAQTVRLGYELNDRMHAEQVFAHNGAFPPEQSFAAVDRPNVTLTSMKKAEDSDALVFRVYEWAGRAGEVKLRVPGGAKSAVATNLMEKPEGAPLAISGDTVTLPIKPYEILTVAVAYGPKR